MLYQHGYQIGKSNHSLIMILLHIFHKKGERIIQQIYIYIYIYINKRNNLTNNKIMKQIMVEK